MSESNALPRTKSFCSGCDYSHFAKGKKNKQRSDINCLRFYSWLRQSEVLETRLPNPLPVFSKPTLGFFKLHKVLRPSRSRQFEACELWRTGSCCITNCYLMDTFLQRAPFSVNLPTVATHLCKA